MTVETMGAAASASEVFGQVYAEFFKRVRGFLMVQCGDAHLAEDLTQDVFTDLWRMASDGRDLSEIERVWPFLKTMAKRALGAHWGLMRTQRELVLAFAEGRDGKDDVEALADTEQDRADIAEQVAERIALAAQLKALPGRQRAAVVRHVVEDLEFRDAARAEGVTAGHLQRLFANGIAQLREANGVTEPADPKQVENERRELARKMFFAAATSAHPMSLGTLGESFGRSHSWAARVVAESDQFTPHQSAAARIRESLTAALAAGEYAPGARLMCLPLAEQYGTNDGTVVGVLRALVDAGQLERRTLPSVRKGYAYFVPETAPQSAPAPAARLRMAA